MYYSIQELVSKKRQIEATTYEINCESVKKPKQDVPIIITPDNNLTSIDSVCDTDQSGTKTIHLDNSDVPIVSPGNKSSVQQNLQVKFKCASADGKSNINSSSGGSSDDKESSSGDEEDNSADGKSSSGESSDDKESSSGDEENSDDESISTATRKQTIPPKSSDNYDSCSTSSKSSKDNDSISSSSDKEGPDLQKAGKSNSDSFINAETTGNTTSGNIAEHVNLNSSASAVTEKTNNKIWSDDSSDDSSVEELKPNTKQNDVKFITMAKGLQLLSATVASTVSDISNSESEQANTISEHVNLNSSASAATEKTNNKIWSDDSSDDSSVEELKPNTKQNDVKFITMAKGLQLLSATVASTVSDISNSESATNVGTIAESVKSRRQHNLPINTGKPEIVDLDNLEPEQVSDEKLIEDFFNPANQLVTSINGLNIFMSDMIRVLHTPTESDKSNYLSDKIIDAHLYLLSRKYRNVVIQERGWYETLLEDKTFAKYNKKNISQNKTMFVPFWRGYHWILFVVYINDKKIVCYDSMAGISMAAYQIEMSNEIMKYITKGAKKQNWIYKLGEAPRQKNYYDCGVHVLITVDYLCTEPDKELKFSPIDVTNYRTKMLKAIINISECNRPMKLNNMDYKTSATFPKLGVGPSLYRAYDKTTLKYNKLIGEGLFALHKFQPNEIIARFIGEIIGQAEKEIREKTNPGYILQLHAKQDPQYLDCYKTAHTYKCFASKANSFGSVRHIYELDSDPVINARIVVRCKKLTLMAIHEINKNEEILCTYNFDEFQVADEVVLDKIDSDEENFSVYSP